MNIFAHLEAGFAEILSGIPKPIDRDRLREVTPHSHVTSNTKPARELPEGRDDFTRESEALI